MADEEKQPQKEIIQVTSLDQLGTQKVILEIETQDSILQIPAHTLTYAQWVACQREIPAPNPPEFAGKGGVIYDRENPDFQRKQDEWNEKVAMLRVLKCLDIPIMGSTQDERLSVLVNTLGAQVTRSVINGLTLAHTGGLARIRNRAETFQQNGDRHSPDMSGEGLASA